MKRLIIATIAASTLAGCTSLSSHADQQHAHAHQHGDDCGHLQIVHNGHIDYLHDGYLHHAHGDHYDEHVIEVSAANPDGHNPVTHAHAGHMHSETDSDHPRIPHGNHIDFLHDGHLHHVHGDHVDEHGAVEVIEG